MKAIDELSGLPNFGSVHVNGVEETGLTEILVCVSRARLDAICSEIERELEEKYVALPKDMDGKYIHIGDRMECGGNVFDVIALSETQAFYSGRDGEVLRAGILTIRHHEPSGVECVLREFFDEYDSVSGYAPDENEVLAKFAERLQLKERDDG